MRSTQTAIPKRIVRAISKTNPTPAQRCLSWFMATPHPRLCESGESYVELGRLVKTEKTARRVIHTTTFPDVTLLPITGVT